MGAHTSQGSDVNDGFPRKGVRLSDDFTMYQRRFFKAVETYVPSVLESLKANVFPKYAAYRKEHHRLWGPSAAEFRERGMASVITSLVMKDGAVFPAKGASPFDLPVSVLDDFPVEVWRELVVWAYEYGFFGPPVPRPLDRAEETVKRYQFTEWLVKLAYIEGETLAMDFSDPAEPRTQKYDGLLDCQESKLEPIIPGARFKSPDNGTEPDPNIKAASQKQVVNVESPEEILGVAWALRTAVATLRSWYQTGVPRKPGWVYPPTGELKGKFREIWHQLPLLVNDPFWSHPSRWFDQIRSLDEESLATMTFKFTILNSTLRYVHREGVRAEILSAFEVHLDQVLDRMEAEELPAPLRAVNVKSVKDHFKWLALYQVAGLDPHQIARIEVPEADDRFLEAFPENERGMRIDQNISTYKKTVNSISAEVHRLAPFVAGSGHHRWLRRPNPGPKVKKPRR